MDLNDYWQQNKRFLVSLGSGLLVFLIGWMIVGSAYGSEVKSVSRDLSANRRNLKDARYVKRDLEQAKDENEALKQAVATLSEAVAFVPRETFRLQPDGGSIGNQYFSRVDEVREELTTLASRRRLRLPEGLGLEILKTQREEIIVRHLEALDVIDRVVRLALDAGARRIEKIQVRLDPGLDSRSGVGAVERTRIKFTITSAAEPIVRLIVLSQSDRFGQPLLIDAVEIVGARSKDDEVRAEITFLAVHLHELEPEGEGN